MAVSGTYYIKKRLPSPELVHGEGFKPDLNAGPPPKTPPRPKVILPEYGKVDRNFFEGDMLFEFEAQPDGTLTGTADGVPIYSGFYTGDEFFTVDYPAGPGRWEVWARVDEDGSLIGMISVKGGGFPNLVYGKKIS